MTENEIAKVVFDAAKDVLKELGPGLLEKAYEECLCYELQRRGIKIERQKRLPVVYKGMSIDCDFVMDVVVEGKVVLELKAVGEMNDLFKAQLLTYLKLTGCKLGLLINFNVPYIVAGIQRIVNGL